MIERIEIQNFQRWRSLTLALDSTTVLTGDNDAGKSAVVRALRWWALNEWPGRANEFISWGEDSASVTVIFRVGKKRHTLSRERSKEFNGYVLDGKRLGAINRSIPEEVASLLSLGVENFQDQDEPPFWICLSSGDAALALNEIFCLQAVDETQANVASELRQARAGESATRSRLEEAEAEVESLSWVADANDLLTQIESMTAAAEDNRRLSESLQDILTRLDWLESREDSLEEAAAAAEKISNLRTRADDVLQHILLLEVLLEKEEDSCRLKLEVERDEASLLKKLKRHCPLCLRQG